MPGKSEDLPFIGTIPDMAHLNSCFWANSKQYRRKSLTVGNAFTNSFLSLKYARFAEL